MNRRWNLSLCAVVGVVGIVATSSPAVQATAAPHSRGSVFWGYLAQPKLDRAYSALNGVSAVTADNVWAVGSSGLDSLVEHWDGTSWSSVPSPRPAGSVFSALNSVDAIAANNVWAVGDFETATGGPRTFIIHWNGSEWRRVPSPNPSTVGDRLLAVSAVAANDIWAVGYDDPIGSTYAHTLTLHWNGGSWSVVRSPAQPRANRGFFGVSATSATSAWAVGTTIDSSGRLKSLAEHWNGTRWHQVPIASPGASHNTLRSVTIAGPGNVWAVGETERTPGPRNQPMVEHFSAGRWQQVRPPGLGGSGYLYSVSADGPDDLWAVGWVSGANLLEHWDGRVWSRFRGMDSQAGGLQGVITHGSTATWAVGLHRTGSTYGTFHERWNGHVWTR